MSGLNMIKINNSAEAAVDGKWSNPGASLYDKLMDGFYSEGGNLPTDAKELKDAVKSGKYTQWHDLLKEAYLVAPVTNIKNSPYGRTPYSRSGCKYPHHVIRNGELVVSISGVKAAYSRACQMGIVKGDVKTHLEKHLNELGIKYHEESGSVYFDEDINILTQIAENFDAIEQFIGKKTDDFKRFAEACRGPITDYTQMDRIPPAAEIRRPEWNQGNMQSTRHNRGANLNHIMPSLLVDDKGNEYTLYQKPNKRQARRELEIRGMAAEAKYNQLKSNKNADPKEVARLKGLMVQLRKDLKEINSGNYDPGIVDKYRRESADPHIDQFLGELYLREEDFSRIWGHEDDVPIEERHNLDVIRNDIEALIAESAPSDEIMDKYYDGDRGELTGISALSREAYRFTRSRPRDISSYNPAENDVLASLNENKCIIEDKLDGAKDRYDSETNPYVKSLIQSMYVERFANQERQVYRDIHSLRHGIFNPNVVDRYETYRSDDKYYDAQFEYHVNHPECDEINEIFEWMDEVLHEDAERDFLDKDTDAASVNKMAGDKREQFVPVYGVLKACTTSKMLNDGVTPKKEEELQGAKFQKMIKGITFGDNFSHALLSFDDSLEHMYSYADDGFEVDNIMTHESWLGTESIYICVMFVKPEEKSRMKKFVKYLMDNQSDTKYASANLLKAYVATPYKVDKRFVCSSFTGYVMAMSNPKNLHRDYSRLRPEDITILPRAFYVMNVKDRNDFVKRKKEMKDRVDAIYKEHYDEIDDWNNHLPKLMLQDRVDKLKTIDKIFDWIIDRL